MQIIYNTEKKFDVQVSNTTHYLSKLTAISKSQWFELGRAESWFLRNKIDKITPQAPIYVMGLARAGTTLLLESITSLPGIAGHRYKDYPFVQLPYAWRSFLGRFATQAHMAQERSHFDGLQVTPESPEAFEEMLWMHFFPQCYTNDSIIGLDGHTRHAEFETYYDNHIRKILLSENADRYVAKGNYNLGRLEYLRRVYPEAKFVIAIRHPLSHIASLIKQHRQFSEMQRKEPRLLEYMRRAGHFEFGLDRRTLRFADDNMPESIHAAWNHGDEVTGWAMYWNMLYARLSRMLKQSPALQNNTLVVKYENLCSSPAKTLAAIGKHCGVEFPADLATNWAQTIHAPAYYSAEYTKEERETIARFTQEAARHFDYDVKAV